MSLALQLARKGRYGVASNPMVGCVIVKDNKNSNTLEIINTKPIGATIFSISSLLLTSPIKRHHIELLFRLF
jgi:hypothetical protein